LLITLVEVWVEYASRRKTKRGLKTSTSKRISQYHLNPILRRFFEFVGRMIEALADPKTWLFALFAALDNVPNSISNQIQIIVLSFGFTTFQTTLLGCVGGVIQIVAISTGVTIASRIPNSRAWVGIAYFMPNLLGVFLVNLLPWHDKVGLLFALWITGMHDVLLRRGVI
jgi:hypothetical protein